MNVIEFRERMAALEPMGASSEYPRFTWGRRRAELRENVATRPSREVREFLKWPIIQECLFTGDNERTKAQMKELWDDDLERWSHAVQEKPFGKPSLMEGAPFTSGNMVHQAHTLKQWEDATGKRIEGLQYVLEIGGGYGANARMMQQSGFTGNHVIYDLPEFLLLQEFYLSNTGCELPKFVSDIEDIKGWWLDLIIAACSLSEMPYDEREKVLKAVWPQDYLFLYQDVYGKYKNIPWFHGFMAGQKKNWEGRQARHNLSHWYAVGWME